MAFKFHELAFTDSVRHAQEEYYGQSRPVRHVPGPDALTDDEISFIQARDSFYMATVSETGWPYLQHRGGEVGFLRVLSPTQLAFADYKGNRQLISVGNLAVASKRSRTSSSCLSLVRSEIAIRHHFRGPFAESADAA